MKKLSKVIHRAIHAHLFRHTFASYCIAANVDIATLSSMISHSNPAITLSVYTHEIQSAQKQEEIKKLKF
jgi:integrase